MQSVLTKIGAL